MRDHPIMKAEQARREIQQQKELPTLTPSVQRILAACEDHHVSQTALAAILGESPTIAARILGLANSAFFGQRDGVHSLPHAITVLGMVMVRSVAAGLALSGIFDTRRCRGFQAERYWASAVLTALLAQQLRPQIAAGVRPPPDSVYLGGLLHNIGLLALVHLHPVEMGRAFAAYAAHPAHALGTHIRAELEIDHYQAGVWLGSKWHFPRDLLLVMEHHYNPAYRGDHWPLALLEGLAARWANQILDGREDLGGEEESLVILGLAAPAVAELRERMGEQLDRVHAIAATFAPD
jgi:HD-like signal output (HDOD) protein